MKPRFKRGDIVFMDFQPTKGHEQDGRRPALIISNDDFPKYTGLYIACPITSTVRNYPSHVMLDNRTKVMGQIMCEQVRTIDLEARNPEKKEECPEDILAEVIDIVRSFID